MDALARAGWIGAIIRRAGAMASNDRRVNRRNIKIFFGSPCLDIDAEGAFNVFIVSILMTPSIRKHQVLVINTIYHQILNS